MSKASKAKRYYEVYQKACSVYSPYELSFHIIFDGDVPIVDKESVLRSDKSCRVLGNEGSSESNMLFCVILNNFYKWDYTVDYNSATIYYELSGDVLYAGVYDIDKHEKTTRISIATTVGSNITATYTYPELVFNDIRKNLKISY